MWSKRGKHKKAQIWVETVIYTLIALVMIGTVLSIIKPRIEESQDKAIIEQSIDVVKSINAVILDIKRAPGNLRIAEIQVKKGEIIIDAVGDRIIFEMQSRYAYSEPENPGSPRDPIVDPSSGIRIRTIKMGKFNNITLVKNYAVDFNITYAGDDKSKIIAKSPTPYSASIANKGEDPTTGKIVIDLDFI